MIRLECPACRRDSYTESVEDYKPCPYCKISFSGKYGIEKRNEVRIKKEIPFVFIYDERNLNANIVDFSKSGIRIKISDISPLPLGNTIDLQVRDFHVKAKVMWVSNKPDPSITMAGFRIVDERLNLLGLV